MKIAFVSPFNPQKSGISDYSEELVPFLTKYMDIDLYVKEVNIKNRFIRNNLPIYHFAELTKNIRQYDTVIYQMGNNIIHDFIFDTLKRHRGIVVLHDYAIHHFMASYYLSQGDTKGYIKEMCYNYGGRGKELAKKVIKKEIQPLWLYRSLDYPLNKRILNNSQGIITTSEFVQEKVNQTTSSPVTTIPLTVSETLTIEEIVAMKDKLREKFAIKEQTMVLGMYGFINPTKRVDLILETLANIKNTGMKDFILYIVGKLSRKKSIETIIEKYELSNQVRMVGYVPSNLFREYMLISDLCFNLRYPTQGESSSTLIKLMSLSKPVIVNDYGSFSEFPDETVVKIPIQNERRYLQDKLSLLIEGADGRKRVGERAFMFVKQHHSPDDIAKKYYQFISQVVRKPIDLRIGEIRN